MTIRLDPAHIADALEGEVSGDQVLAPSPGHSPSDRSLSVRINRAGDDIVVYSFIGGDAIALKDYVRQKIGMEAWKPNGRKNGNGKSLDDEIGAALSDKPQAKASGSPPPKARVKITKIYEYTDAGGELQYQVCRLEPKSFRQRRRDGKGEWIWNLDEVKRVPYRLVDLNKYPDGSVFVCEGEKDADRIAELGHCASTVASGKWTPDCVQAFAGRDIFIMQDNDAVGTKKANEAAAVLHGTAKSIRVVLLPNLPDKGDVSDWLDAGNAARLVEVCMEAPLWTPPADAKDETPKTLIKSSAQFVGGHVPPDYVVVGLLVRRFLYSLTGQTGSGKTCVTLFLAACAALGQIFAGHITKKCRVLYAAAENPEDVRMRWIALAQRLGFDPAEIEVYFTEGTFKISAAAAKLKAEAKALGGEFGLVIIDTGPAFFEGDDENSRAQMGAHARLMRSLIDTIPGGPAVVVNCHPVKNATADNLLPAGGGTFLNEVDGNLTCAKNDSLSELHWQGKFRGAEFAAMGFLIKTATHPDLKDSDGRLLPTVICEPIGEQAREELAEAGRKDEDAILALIEEDPRTSFSKLALKMGWKLYSGEPHKTKAKRCVDALKKAKLVKENRAGRLSLTPEGKKALKDEK
jgi:hypothetical protein